jgi:hypothetical protein
MNRKFYDLLCDFGGGVSIKEQCEYQYEQIRKSEERLKELRAMCKHNNTYEGKYSWRVGCIDSAIICSDCGVVVSPIFEKLNVEQEVKRSVASKAK